MPRATVGLFGAAALVVATLGGGCPPDTPGAAPTFSIALYDSGQGPGTTGNPFPHTVFWVPVRQEARPNVPPCSHWRFNAIDALAADIWSYGGGTYTQTTGVPQGASTSFEFLANASAAPTTDCRNLLTGQFRGQASGDLYVLSGGILLRPLDLSRSTPFTRGTNYVFTGFWTTGPEGGAPTAGGSYYLYDVRIPTQPPTVATSSVVGP